MFDVPADAYDRFMGRFSVQLSPQLADLGGVRAGSQQRVLDVGCGPGALTTELVARIGPENVAAVDPSASFVSATRERHPGVDVQQAPAEQLPFPGAGFDAALAQLVVLFMKDPVAGLREMARVTHSGGIVAACVWDLGGDRSPLTPMWRAVGDLDGAPDDESHLPGARAGELAELFAAAGLREVEETELEASVTYGSFEEWWTPYTYGVGPAGAYVARLDDDGRGRLEERCRQMLGEPPFTVSAVAWATRGIA